MNLAQWTAAHPIKPGMFFKNSAEAMLRDFEKMQEWFTVAVIGSHRSKSIDLPVVRLEGPGLRIYLRDNFMNWAVSVDSDTPRNWDQSNMKLDAVHECYFEGFERSGAPVYEIKNARQISFHLEGEIIPMLVEIVRAGGTATQPVVRRHSIKTPVEGGL